MKRIIITGAGGFIGRNLAEALARSSCEVFAITHREVDPMIKWQKMERGGFITSAQILMI